MNARAAILARVRKAGGPAVPAPGAAIVPARGRGDRPELLERFSAMAAEAGATLETVDGPADVPAAVDAWLERNRLPRRVVAAPAMSAYPWDAAPGLAIRYDRARDGDPTGIGPAVAGIAETGSLMVASGSAAPYTLNFLPDNHVAVLKTVDIVGAYEDAWRRIGRPLPRTVTLITGPSRSSDIERTVTIGVHGPLRLHVILTDAEDDAPS